MVTFVGMDYYFSTLHQEKPFPPMPKVAVYVPNSRVIVVKVENAIDQTGRTNATIVETDIRVWPLPVEPRDVYWNPNETTPIPPGKSQLFISKFTRDAFQLNQTVRIELIIVMSDGTNVQISRSHHIETWTKPLQ